MNHHAKPFKHKTMNMQRIAFLFWIFVLPLCSQTTSSLALEDCYKLAKQNYPLVKQRELIEKSKDYSVQNAGKGYFPQLNINGQASYQSAVTQIPFQIPGMNIPSLSKDQYKLYGEINQPLYDGGLIKAQKLIQETNAGVELQKLDVELYKLKERINQLFFGILMMDEQLKQVELLKKDLQTAVAKTEASIANGIAFKNNLDILKVEQLKIEQRAIEYKANRSAYLQMLGLFLNQVLDENTQLIKPQNKLVSQNISRPELLLFDQQKKNVDLQNDVLRSRVLPKFNLFLQAGYGRPALNMLSNTFESYYIGGLRLNWSLSGLYTLKNDKAILDLSRKNIDLQKELFIYNTNLSLKQQSAEVQKLSELLRSDDEIITLRSRIKTTSSAQLENGVISSNDYVRELNAEDQAKETKILHEVQLLMAQYNQQTTAGE